MTSPVTQTSDVLSFGPFRLVAGERLLIRDGKPVELGARAFDILMALLSRPNEVVGKKDLLSLVWPDVVVEEGSLRFHMASLRKALGDGKDGARYITTLAGRGYCFVSPVSRSTGHADSATPVAVSFTHANLPNRLGRMVGRDDDVLNLSTQLTTSRFVTIVGPGGVGKTTVAVAVGHHLSDAFAGAALFVDLGMLSDPKLVATAVASMLGLSVQSEDVRPSLIAYLRDKQILLILDTCEHLIEAVAALAESILEAAPKVHILTTSREALQIDGEHIYRLDALAYPLDNAELTAAAIQLFPATRMFVERAIASGARLDVDDTEAAIVASICQKLDGVALAIELAARRVGSYGLQQTASLIDQRLTLLWSGSRTAPPRQKTLQAMLDWSYGLLSELERTVLRRLAIFVGHFTLDAALEVVASESLDQSAVFGAIDSLVAKSMVTTRPVGAMMRYRLLDTTRAYTLEIAIDDVEFAELAARHAGYYRRWLEQAGTEWATLSTGTERAPYFAGLNNVRAALERCFGENGDVKIGVGLAAAAAPVFLAMSLVPECLRWSKRALLALDDSMRGGSDEMHLQAGLGISSMHLYGEDDATRMALSRSATIAEERGDVLNQIGLLGMLRMFHFRAADFKTALRYAKRCRSAAETAADPAAIALARSMLGRSLHMIGDLNGARFELEASLHQWSRAQRTTIYLARDLQYPADVTLARTLWLQGHPTEAAERAHQVIKSVSQIDHPPSLAVVLAWATSVFLWTGDLENAEKYIDATIYQAESYSLGPFVAVGQARRAELDIRRGNAQDGVDRLQACLEAIHRVGYELLTTEFNISLAQGLATIGQIAEGSALVDRAIQRVEANGDDLYIPELLRVKGGLLLSMPQEGVNDAETCFTHSIELSRRQGARAWELRTAIDLATFWADQGRSKNAGDLLRPVVEQFAKGSKTTDIKTAERLLASFK